MGANPSNVGIHSRWVWTVAAFAAACAMSCAACSTDPSAESGQDDVTSKGDGAHGVGEGTEWIQQLKRAHAEADAVKSDGQRREALHSLEQALSRLPAGERPGDVWLRQDLLSRLADLELQLGDADKALRRANEGLGYSEATSVPASNLLMTKGRALERLERKAEAVKAYHQALVMNQELMERSLKGQ
jgi:tetratricopeptide (TPR) repeat protein